MDLDVVVGPFGSSCVVEDDRASDVVATVVRVAFEHGASHVNIDVEVTT
jgi:hypothetical protein